MYGGYELFILLSLFLYEDQFMHLSQEDLKSILNNLRNASSENEVFEFKEAKNSYDFTKLGKYFSALSNEANLKGVSYSWLIFGIKDKGRTVVSSQYRPVRSKLDNLKGEIAKKTTNRITFMEIYELMLTEGRVIMLQIPAAPRGVPIAFDGHYYGRDGEELSPLNIEEIERIRSQYVIEDWSAAIISDATVDDLDPDALKLARENYKSKFPTKIDEVDSWNDITFLNKAKVTIKGKITRTAILLLGKDESEHYLSPTEAKIRWVLKDLNNQEKDYEVFCCPFILSVDKVYGKIRNLKYRYMKDGTLFPDEILKYEPFVIREALNNCIAHQDYSKSGRINVIEIEDEQLIFTNYGTFIPGSVEKVVSDDAPEEYYRNKFLRLLCLTLKWLKQQVAELKRCLNIKKNAFFRCQNMI